jgi:hypothetical protein
MGMALERADGAVRKRTAVWVERAVSVITATVNTESAARSDSVVPAAAWVAAAAASRVAEVEAAEADTTAVAAAVRAERRPVTKVLVAAAAADRHT